MKLNPKYYRVLNMLEAIQLIEGNDLLDVKTNLAIARMRAHGGGIAMQWREIVAKMQADLAEQVKGKKPEEIHRLNDEFSRELERVGTETETGEYDYPELKASQFEAQQDIVRAGGRVYKKGEPLVPTKFFILMEDFITE